MKRNVLLLSGLLLGLSACSSDITIPPQQKLKVAAINAGAKDLKMTSRADGGLNATGTLNGQPFALRIPAHWNGKTLLFAHGYRSPEAGATETVPDPNIDPSTGAAFGTAGLLTTAYNQGFAVADSAYAKIGYAVREGMSATHGLHDLMRQAGSDKQYLAGVSMGGNIAVGLLEKYPQDYVGGLTLCGVVSGWRSEMRYLLDFRVVYDALTRGTPYALPGNGDALTPNAAYTQQAVNNSVGMLFGAAGKGDAQAKAIIGQVAKVTGAAPDPISFITPLAVTVNGLQDLLTTTQGSAGYSNVGKVYIGSADDATLNATVQRITATPASAAYLDANYTPTGNLQTKLLSVHNTSDPLVPASFENEYAALVGTAGKSANLVTQWVDAKPVNLADLKNSGPAHCYFTPAQLDTAWNEIRGWVEQGTRPQDGRNITQ